MGVLARNDSQVQWRWFAAAAGGAATASRGQGALDGDQGQGRRATI